MARTAYDVIIRPIISEQSMPPIISIIPTRFPPCVVTLRESRLSSAKKNSSSEEVS